MINWENIQKRYMDPVSSKDLNVDLNIVNNSITSILDTKIGIINGLETSIFSNKEIKLNKGSFICDNVFIHFTEDIIININDIYLFNNGKFKTITSYGIYSLIMSYKYSRNIKNIPFAKIFIIKDTENYQLKENQEFCINNFIVDSELNIIQIIENHPTKDYLNKKIVTLSQNIINQTFENNLSKIDGGLI